jgi:hypothetical protein
MADDDEWSKNPLDYTLFGGLAAMFGSNDDEDSDSSASACGEGSFIDCGPGGTGKEISGAYWACGACDYRPVRREDSHCPSCGEVVDWDESNPDHHVK